MSKSMGLLLILVVLLGGATAIILKTARPDVGQIPTETVTVTVPAEQTATVRGQEIFYDEDSTLIPNVTSPDILSLIMVDEVREGKGPLDRCHDYGGELTLDLICHGVDY